MNQDGATISETAHWVAAYRALETERSDALFRDPLAARLAGERGHDIASKMTPNLESNTWPAVIRTKLIDDLIAKSIAEGCDRVLNLAAGLDARPYRLMLSESLEWIEADLPVLIDEKEQQLADEKPRCKLTRERVDLADTRARGELLHRALAGSKRALVLTEGLLPYLEDAQVQSLGRDLSSHEQLQWWIMDLLSPKVIESMRRRAKGTLGKTAELKWAPENGTDYFLPFGWRVADVHSVLREAAKRKRLSLFMRICAMAPEPRPNRPGFRPWNGIVRYVRSAP